MRFDSRFFELCTAAAVLIAGTALTAQNTLRVPAQFPTVQAAIDAAQTSDTVLVDPGRYGAIDYRGKTLVIKSTKGPEQTILDGALGPRGPVVTMSGPGATIEGFTIQNGSGVQSVSNRPCPIPCYATGLVLRYAQGGGILATASGAVIKNNIIRNNVLANIGTGAGISVRAGGLIHGNLITGNSVSMSDRTFYCTLCGPYQAGSRGGGVYGFSTTFLSNNVITQNRGSHGAGVSLNSGAIVNCVIAHNDKAGVEVGPWSASDTVLTNNTIVYNKTFGILTEAPYLGKISVTNCIVRGNGQQIEPGVAVVDYSNVEGGGTGTNIDQPTKFVDAARGDYHILHDSPERDAGTTSTLLPPDDFEGNARVVGPSVDIGADEFGRRLYVTGNPTPGGVVHVKMIGAPGQSTYWAYSIQQTLLSPPAMIPGAGNFYLAAPFFVQSSGVIPPSGIVIVPVPIPAGTPSGAVLPIQALVGPRLTNPWLQTIR